MYSLLQSSVTTGLQQPLPNALCSCEESESDAAVS